MKSQSPVDHRSHMLSSTLRTSPNPSLKRRTISLDSSVHVQTPKNYQQQVQQAKRKNKNVDINFVKQNALAHKSKARNLYTNKSCDLSPKKEDKKNSTIAYRKKRTFSKKMSKTLDTTVLSNNDNNSPNERSLLFKLMAKTSTCQQMSRSMNSRDLGTFSNPSAGD